MSGTRWKADLHNGFAMVPAGDAALTQNVQLRVSRREHRALLVAASRVNLSLAAFARAILTSNPLVREILDLGVDSR
jgi:hypothetical protein